MGVNEIAAEPKLLRISLGFGSALQRRLHAPVSRSGRCVHALQTLALAASYPSIHSVQKACCRAFCWVVGCLALALVPVVAVLSPCSACSGLASW